ncbi:hypothetical protein BRPE64_CCDS06000 [Caballeronia insecticola]|uniref:Uncharacterized protein n=1 Tax=Caballeronia insecticola TaxID=758793 RepID=R4WPT5_9BURK|nr:hypothetical protein BRPE64_CCDS06000 [Caballeronia insecticola]
MAHRHDSLYIQTLTSDEHVDPLVAIALRFDAEQVSRLQLHG